ncbi:hypothetical protein DCCM_0158 [Desulfocucumis palustris]|uniref:Uncharacterized protein n=1 Tax=Desulfocucumis palustris TaxID=1898651 RepID=A0A2L2X7B8_9FIRM|nr:hypothetical protein DCCM_0158 [Desulfocucumis palustris]
MKSKRKGQGINGFYQEVFSRVLFSQTGCKPLLLKAGAYKL